MRSTATASKLLLVVLGLGAGLLLAEVITRAALPRPGFYSFPEAEQNALRPHPTRGFAYRSNVRHHVETSEYTIDFVTNSLGFRVPVERTPEDSATHRLLAVGNSFTQGHGVQAKEAWPQVAARSMAGLEVINAGVSGYSVRQACVTAREVMSDIEVDVLALGVYTGGLDRLRDPYVLTEGAHGLVSRSRLDDVVVEDGGFVYPEFASPALQEIDLWMKQHWHFGAYLAGIAGRIWREIRLQDASPQPAPSEAGIRSELRPLFDALLRCRAIARERDLPLIVLMINRQGPDGSFADEEWRYNRAVRRFAERHELRLVDPLPELSGSAGGEPVYRLGEDPHWSAAAHRVAGRLVADTIRSLLSRPGS